MLKLVRGPAPIHVIGQTYQFKVRVHLPFSEHLETIQIQARLEVIDEEVQHLMQMVTLAEITPSETTLKIYPALRNFKSTNTSKSTSH